jgi:hypothetical protein
MLFRDGMDLLAGVLQFAAAGFVLRPDLRFLETENSE